MKHVALVSLVVLCVAAVVGFAATNEVSSVNAVGYVKTDISNSMWKIMSVPLDPISTQAFVTVSDLFPDAPVGTTVWSYNDGWSAEQRFPLGWFPTTNQYIRGDALFVNAPGAGGPHSYVVMGEVPNSESAPSSTVFVATGWSLVGFAYPVDMALTNSVLNTTGPSTGDAIWSWNTALNSGDGGWEQVSQKFPLGWFPTDGVVFEAGKGYFYSAVSGFNWVESQPYSL